jgi:hypothetical protein
MFAPDGTARVIDHSPPGATAAAVGERSTVTPPQKQPDLSAAVAGDGDTVRGPLGLICGARSGDKGGNANIGLWARSPEEYQWLRNNLTIDRLRQLLPESETLPVHRYELPNLLALNFVVVGLLGDGVASSNRPDPQAKGLAEYVRSRHVELPAAWATPPAPSGQAAQPGYRR